MLTSSTAGLAPPAGQESCTALWLGCPSYMEGGGRASCPATATGRARKVSLRIYWCVVLLSTTTKRIYKLAFLLALLPRKPYLEPMGTHQCASVPSCVV